MKRAVLALLKEGAFFLEERQLPNSKRVAEELLLHLLGKSRSQLYLSYDLMVDEGRVAEYMNLLKRASTHEPWEYIVGSVFFFGCRILVNSNVLIPRVETELMLDLACQEMAKKDLNGKVVWDLCCGSGALGIGLKKKFSEQYPNSLKNRECDKEKMTQSKTDSLSCVGIKVVLSDISKSALEVAKKNCDINAVDVEIRQGDLLEPFANERADFIFCNPPYISKREYKDLDPSVKNFEPELALVAGESGLEFYKRLSINLLSHLKPLGRAYLEIGETQGGAVKEIFQNHSRILKDYFGKDRFIFLENL